MLGDRDAAADAYAGLINRQPWHWFVTLTFKPVRKASGGRFHTASQPGMGVHPERADKAFRLFVSCINREIYGRNWHRKPHGGVVWVRGQEFHKDGRIHFHAVLAAPDRDLNACARRLSWMDWWAKEFGWARIERPASNDAVAIYVSKYVAKDGEVDFSPNFGRYMPPELFGLRGEPVGSPAQV